MTTLRSYLDKKRAAGEKVLSIYLTAGYPDQQATVPLLNAITDAGADLIELGIPFSDPLADGPTIQSASQAALAAGTTLQSALTMVSNFRENNDIPIILMGTRTHFFNSASTA